VVEKTVIRIERVSTNLLSNLASRDVALWVRSLPKRPPDAETVASFLGLPWRLVLLEKADPEVLESLEAAASFNDPQTRKRGFVQLIDTDPSRIELPQRSLPIYLLDGRSGDSAAQTFESRLRRMTMLEALRRSGAREILLLAHDLDPIPSDLTDVWASGFRAYLTIAADTPDAARKLAEWVEAVEPPAIVQFVTVTTGTVVADILRRYNDTYPEERRIIRVRDVHGHFKTLDITEIDEPERPILESYSLIEERDLAPLVPGELAEEDFIGFFQNPEASWRPYAAGLPWMREPELREEFKNCLRKLDAVGSEENVVAYIASESGAGGTTTARMLAWEAARDGYPVLVAKSLPFVPEALPIVNFLTRIGNLETGGQRPETLQAPLEEAAAETESGLTGRRYETPWVILFDTIHWQYRDSELVQFRNELTKGGRPVCVLVVTGTLLSPSFFNGSVFRRLGELNHAIDLDAARQLGVHLNQFLRTYGRQREQWQWERFYEDHTVRYLEGVAAFWVALSFWIQGQYDLSESIQEWMYRRFKATELDVPVRRALIRIAAMSSERLPLPEVLLASIKA
jgi:hypothetical protein